MSTPEPLTRAQLRSVFVLLAAPYLLNDLANIFVSAPIPWLVCDHGTRLLSLASVAWAVRRGAFAANELALGRVPWRRALIAGLIATAGGLLLNSAVMREVGWSLAPWQLGRIPPIEPPGLRWLDCFGGVMLVAVSEELVFRGALPALLARLGASPTAGWLVATVWFGLAHWSLGPGHVVQTALIGGVFGLMAQYGRSLWPVIVAHYVVDVVAFGATL
ncbi:MAG: CPBP family intramembrane metalloprotease [Verrucomicrobia bacterium]|nr:CPBP family intramembrane metalloprotease [Verrucomicrobiota bacterium]